MNFIEKLKEAFLFELSSLMVSLPNIIIGIVGFIFIWFAARRIQILINKQLTKRMDDPLLADFLARMLKVFIIIGGFLFFLKMIGWGAAAAGIMATAGVGAFVIGFALRDIGENFLAGIVMAFQRPFGVGDTIEVNGIIGVIVGLSLRETHVKTFDGKDVFIPNSILLKNPLYNYTLDGFLRKRITIGLEYGADIEKAILLVTTELNNIQGVLAGQKSPTVSVSDVTDIGLELIILFWIDTDGAISGTEIKKNVIKQSFQALNKNEVPLSKHFGIFSK